MAQKMKKSVSELKKDLIAANKQIKLAKASGNKRQLNLGRRKRLSTWRILRDEHGMEAPSHIAKALGAPKEKKKEPTEFTKPQEEKTGGEMVFTTTELYGAKEAAKLAKVDRERNKMLAKMTPKQKKEYWANYGKPNEEVAKTVKMPKKKASSTQEMKVQVRAWLSKDKDYYRLIREIARLNALVDKASGKVKKLGPKKSEELLTALDTLYAHTMARVDAESKLRQLLKKKEAQFRKEFAAVPELIKSYSDDLKKFSELSYLRHFRPFNSYEAGIMEKVNYGAETFHARREEKENKKLRAEIKVKGKNRLEEEMKKALLEKAQDLIEDLQEPTAEERKTMREIEKAASNPSVGSSEMLRVAVGREKLTDDEAASVELALAGETVDKLETRVAAAGRREKPVRVASRGRRKGRKGKKPVKVASLTKTKKGRKRA